MRNVLKIRSIGNSAGVILPKEELDRLKLQVGDQLTMKRSAEGFELSAYDDDFEKKMRAYERSVRKLRNAYNELAK